MTASWGVYNDCVTTDTIGRAMKRIIASPVGRKNQKKVECFMIVSAHSADVCREGGVPLCGVSEAYFKKPFSFAETI
jgi:hypothetical protein